MNKIKFLLIVFCAIISCSKEVYVLPTHNGSDLVNKKGKIIYSANFHIHDFDEGLAEFDDPVNKKHGCINKKGKIVFYCDDDYIRFFDRLACINKDDTLYFINKKGIVVLKPQYQGKNLVGNRNWAYFSEGLTPLAYYINDSTYRMIFINKKGKVAFDKQYLSASNFSNGLALVMFLDSTSGYIDKKRKVKFTLKKGEWGESFSEGYAWIHDGDSSFFINTKGKRICNKLFYHPQPFYNEMAEIKSEGYYGFINTKGETVIEPQYRLVRNFSCGVAPVEKEIKGGKYGDFETFIIDKKGKVVLGPFMNITFYEFVNGLSIGNTLILGDTCVEYFLINKKGKILYKSHFCNIEIPD